MIAAKIVEGREKRMRAGARVINIISVIIVVVGLLGVGWMMDR